MRNGAIREAPACNDGDGIVAAPIEADSDVGLLLLRPPEQRSLDYGRVGLSPHDHPMRHVRPALGRRRVRTAEQFRTSRHGEAVRVAGMNRGEPVSGAVVVMNFADGSGTGATASRLRGRRTARPRSQGGLRKCWNVRARQAPPRSSSCERTAPFHLAFHPAARLEALRERKAGALRGGPLDESDVASYLEPHGNPPFGA